MTPQMSALAALPINIEEEMRQSYLDYAMSVIVGRALPDVRDGLKPVHRRILYAMSELGLSWNRPFKKAARLVGDVIGKYHPHGDTAVYDTIVRMAQDFSLRYPLVDGQGNFGSLDGDAAAAMRYTEVRMSQIAHELLTDIDKETVDFVPNYDESLLEPYILPSRVPNLLINGSSGIAVGMATNIPPHNLSEVTAALLLILDNPGAELDELMTCITGPDFPTGALIYGKQGIREAYETGRGLIQQRGRAIIENPGNDKQTIVITEVPYQINKAKLVEKIAELVKEKKVEGISELRDESDRDGVRIVIELKKHEKAEVILNQLYHHTPLQNTFGVIMLALVGTQPMILNLKQILQHFIDFRREIVIRRTQYELKKAQERCHILEGLKIALDNLDAVIQLIKTSPSPHEARNGLMQQFNLSQVQAQSILEMRLQRLTALEQDKILKDLEETRRAIKGFQEILGSRERIREEIRKELVEIKEKYGDKRKTEIIEQTGEFNIEDLIPDEPVVITVTHTGYIKRNPLTIYRAQKRGGKGKMAMDIREEDFVEHLFIASTHDYMLFFTNRGKVYWIKVHEIAQNGRAFKGKAIANLISFEPGEKIASMMPVKDFHEGKYLVMATKKGFIKKTSLVAYSNPRSGGIIALLIDKGDELIGVKMTDGTQGIFLATKMGKAIHFPEEQIRGMGRVARGVHGIRLSRTDEVVSLEIVDLTATILTVTENGFGKRTKLSAYRVQNRGGQGIINLKVTPKNGQVVEVKQVTNEDELMIVTSEGKLIRLKAEGISVIGRNTQGFRLIDIGENNRVVGAVGFMEQKVLDDGLD